MRHRRLIGLILTFLLLVIGMNAPSVGICAQDSSKLSGVAHVQGDGDVPGTFDGRTLTLGTTGKSKRLEQICITLDNRTGYKGDIVYKVHRQTYGWTQEVSNGKPAGTTGEGKRLEAICISLTGELEEHYSVRYRVHAQGIGWAQGWRYDGAVAGTVGESRRLECLEVQLVSKNDYMGVSYKTHRQTYGWEQPEKADGETAGTVGEGKRLEGITIALSGKKYSGSVLYRTHVQTYGWQDWAADGEVSGTTGESKRLEAIEIKLEGEVAEHYDIYYRVHAQTFGWLGWAKNGERAGTAGRSKRLEAIEIQLIPKGEAMTDNTKTAFVDYSLDKLLTTAIQPIGNTVYVWGGGWNEEDTAAGIEARTIGVSPRWKEFADAQGSDYDYRETRYQIHDGLDCTGFVGWTVYNTLNSTSGNEGYVIKSTKMADTFASYGWGSIVKDGTFRPGDICSMKGHAWMSLGTCSDGSVLLVHSSPPGVSICGTKLKDGSESEAIRLARKVMKTYYPDWYSRFPKCDADYNYLSATVFRWDKSFLTDANELQEMTPEEVVRFLYEQ